MPIPINEIFGPTIQGEGSDIGKPTMFLRTFGCDFDCTWCDTRYAVDMDSGVFQNVTEEYIVRELLDSGCKRVVISGGNPLIHDLDLLITMLKEHNFEVHIETQGSIYKSYLEKVDKINISPKGPSAGDLITDKAMLTEFLQDVGDTPLDIKIVIFDGDDYEYALATYRMLKRLGMSFGGKYQFILQQGTFTESDDVRSDIIRNLESLIDVVVNEQGGFGDDIRILPQLHTLIWGTERGY